MTKISDVAVDACIGLCRVMAKLLGIHDYEARVARLQRLSPEESKREMLAALDKLRDKVEKE
jgi:hypothetical protein